MSYSIRKISLSDPILAKQVEDLLRAEGIRRDRHLDYTCGIFDEDEVLIGTGSCYGNTMRCFAVSQAHQGEGLLGKLTEHLMEVQLNRGNFHLFLYTKPKVAKQMGDMGFSEIARVDGLVFMENRKTGFSGFCKRLAKKKQEGSSIAALVMNANPFTLGHQYLAEKAAQENDVVHLFVLSEDAGPIPAAVRKQLVEEGVSHLKNVVVHDSGPYIISNATFPSYFLKDEDTVIRTQAQLDILVFSKIAQVLGIQKRYAGEEKNSHVTALYNEIMGENLPTHGIAFVEIPRLEKDRRAISASTVRQAIHDGKLREIRELVPETTYAFFASAQGEPVCEAIRQEQDVIHY